jgi:Bacterial Ig-like domain (group 3)
MRQKTRVSGALAALAAGAVLAMAPPATAATITTTALVSSANPSTAGQSVTLTATVSGDVPTGQVTFNDSGVDIGTAPLSSGVATLVTGALTVGDHAFKATYTGDPSNDFSEGTLTQTVNAVPAPVVTVKPPKIKLVASTTQTSVGDKVRLRWHSKRADSVMASGDWAGSQKSKGSAWVRIAERGKHVFKLTVRNAVGSKTATVKVMASRKAKELDLVVTEELTMVGSDVDVTADGLAKGEEYTIRLNGKSIMTGKANKKGDVARTFVLAKTTLEGALPLTITGSNPGRVGTALLNVIKPKKLAVEVDETQVQKDAELTLTVTGLVADEPLTVMYEGKKLTSDTADADGEFTYTFDVGKVSGQHTIKVIGADPSRVGETTFKITGHGAGNDPGQPGRVYAGWF